MGWGKADWKLLFTGYRISVSDDNNVLEMDSVKTLYNIANILNATELCT